MTAELAEEVHGMGVQAVRVVMLATNRRLLEMSRGAQAATGAHTPSGAIPVHLKGNTKPVDEAPSSGQPRRKPGGQPGHTGVRRSQPAQVTEEVRVPAMELCPDCKNKLNEPLKGRDRTRTYEDIPENVNVQTIKATIPRQYCPCCKKEVEPHVVDVLPKAMIGHRLCATSAWLHYGMGISVAPVRGILHGPLSFVLSEGGLMNIWQRLADILEPWQEQIKAQAMQCAVLHADETGWRVNGATHWLWCFTGSDVCSSQIDAHRSIEAVLKFFTQEFKGTLVTDFYRVYDHVQAGDRQYCIAHLIRDLREGDKVNSSETWQRFSKACGTLLRDALDLRKQADFDVERYQDRSWKLERKLMRLVEHDYDDQATKTLAQRLRRTQDHILTFLFNDQVPATNNHAERMIRPAVIARKISQSNKSDAGARTQERLMSIFATLKLRGHADPSKLVVDALRQYVASGSLPPLPNPVAASG